MPYYRFQHERPNMGDNAHCFTTLKKLKEFVNMMKYQDPEFLRMKFWEVEGHIIKHDEGDVEVKVISARQIFV